MKTKLVKEDIPVTYHCSSLITHHFKDYIHLAPSFNFHPSIFFTLFVGPIPVTHCRLFFCQYPNSPNLVKKKREKRNPGQAEVKERRRRKKKKKNRTANQEKKRRRKSQKWSKVATGYCLWVPYMCLITILLLSYELWKLKTAKMCFQFP